jgi:dihydroorotate dehydrogenase (NAD+) catalytic subunit
MGRADAGQSAGGDAVSVPAMGAEVRLGVEVAGLRLKNPLLAASGTFGYGLEYEGILDLARLGGIVSKGLYLEPRDGCEVPRIVETPSGLLNAIGLQGIGVRAYVRDVLPALDRFDTAIVVNVCGDTVEEYAEVSRILDDAPGVDALEINISCPNVKKGGLAFGGDPRLTHDVVAAVRRATRRPVIPKLSPNVADITLFARVCEEAGADALSCINTLLGLSIDVEKRRPRLAFGTGGLSGPAIRPIAVRMAWQAAAAVRIPVLGIGGIITAEDALEFLIAGCRAVQVGTANFVDPGVYDRILDGLSSYLRRHGLTDLNEVVGTLAMPVSAPPEAPPETGG